MNLFNCEMEGACNTCLDLISQKKNYSTDNTMSKRRPPVDCNQLLSWYLGKYIPVQKTNDFESAREL